MAPEGEGYSLHGAAAQCLTSRSDLTATGSAFIRTRLAPLLLGGDPTLGIIPLRPSEAVCLSQEEGRWRLRRTQDPQIVSE